MALNNQNESQALPGVLQQRIENGLNLVTEYEAEATRLQKFIVSKKDEINKLQEEKVYTQGQISSAKDEIKHYQDSISILKKDLESLAQKENDSTNELTMITAKIVKAKQLLETVIADTESRKNDIASQEEDMAKRTSSLKQSETSHAEKVARLQDALK